jgi:NADH-quinone oxidoreductase subunit L
MNILELLWLVPATPLAGFLILALAGGRMTKRAVTIIGTGSIAISTIVAAVIGINFIVAPPAGHSFTQTLWTWLSVGNFAPQIAFYLDALSLVMMLVVTFVSFLIHLYSAEFMEQDEGCGRFFAYMNLFVSSMLILVLADNLLFLYLGWEGVGLCSYLLIGFWYKKTENGYAGIKAFIVTRVGDTAMAIGLFLLFVHFGTLQIQPLMQQITDWVAWPEAQRGHVITIAAALLLGGALGKSAQLPLQTWLPDAMAGPSPVSALIHAATMVTAGVYLIARTHILFTAAPTVQYIVAIIGAVTLLMAGFSALTQHDIKRVLAYSTISQIGYMFLALGVGAWTAAMFHFMIHAFFKSLLFLAAGVVIVAMNEEHNMFKMGGLRKQLPFAFWTFLIGSASLSALPVIDAGFYSKDLILWNVWSSQLGGPWFLAAGLGGAFLTAIYSFRMIFIVFFGKQTSPIHHRPAYRIRTALVILAVLSVIGGFVELPDIWTHVQIFSSFIKTALPPMSAVESTATAELTIEIVSSAVALLGIYVAYLVFLRKSQMAESLVTSPVCSMLHRLWFANWGFDLLYDVTLVRPYKWFARINKNDVVDAAYDGLARFSTAANQILSLTQNGRVRWYAAGVTAGTIIVIAILVFV